MNNGYDIEYINKKISHWTSMKNIYDKLEDERIRNINTNNLLSSIYTISDKNSTNISLTKQTKTIPLIDSFYKSNNQFLIIRGVYQGILFKDGNKYYYNISPVITKISSKIHMLPSKMTITDMKNDCITFIKNSNSYTNEEDRNFYLIKSIIDLNLTTESKGTLFPFKVPCQFNAQQKSNRTGYGWDGSYGVLTEGTLYGETTQFAIIGIMVD